ncbi:MAG: helix-turn-helix domain-containing protein [Psychroflexus halocasei]|uniref:helix-turn-helix domain-containing protein n=1 Tax=Psychroflexus sp. S27 TaxID=1982757 RepID=UPI001863EEB4|nr:helix-turn-helix domain-containing protein [Psychroflexus sp. S27]
MRVVLIFSILLLFGVLLLLGVRLPIGLLLGPMLFFIVVDTVFDFKKTLLHITPFSLYFLCKFYLNFNDLFEENINLYYIVYDALSVISLTSYLYAVSNYRLKHKYTDARRFYINQMFFSYALYIVVYFSFLIRRLFNIDYEINIDIIWLSIALINTMLIISIIYMGMNYRSNNDSLKRGLTNNKNIYGLSKAELEDYSDKIIEYCIENDKIYKLNFDLETLSKDLDIPKHHLSFCFSHCLGLTFYKLLATYRINRAVRLIEESPSLSLDSIAHECGYSSRSTFNKHFKNILGTLPSEYLDKTIT